ncbi:hypothetical protein [Streptomyces sp. NPDC021224]|uniref:hypothetical protein n=1 Tax=unclassified Streptomyces TaxID=2593676 RepID=UPI0037A711E9
MSVLPPSLSSPSPSPSSPSSRRRARRTTLRAAVVTAALAGAVLLPAAGAFADTSAGGSGSPKTSDPSCVVTTTVPSTFGGWTVELTISPDGPKAVLKNEKGEAVATLDRAHPADEADGIRIKDADTAKPVFQDRPEGGPTPWHDTPFPALPAGCTGTDPGTGGGSDSGTGPDTPIGGPVVQGCTVTQKVVSHIGGWTVDLVNSPDGPKAVLRDEKGKAWSTLDRAHPADEADGIRIKDADTAKPVFQDRAEGGPTPWHNTPFPALPAGCAPAATPTPSATPTATHQTKVVPDGSVAAGTTGSGGHVNVTLVAAGSAFALAGAAGLSYVALRRRHTSPTA